MNFHKKTMVLFLIMLFSLMAFQLNTKAETTQVIEVAGNEVTVMIDPVVYESQNLTFLDVQGKVVLYSPSWHYEKTNRTESVDEYIATINASGKYEITHKFTTSQQTIPLNGVVLSVPSTLGITYQVGDLIDVLDHQVHVFDKAVTNQDGVRVPISALNQSNTSGRFVYYNYQFGTRTGTNTFSGNEIIVKYDKTQSAFVVDKINAGGDNQIPKDGFVISTSGSPTRFVLGNSFNVGDEIQLVNFDFVELEKTTTKTFTAVDVLRLAEYLVVYPWPKTSSGQNIHGYEVAVDANGVVVEKDVLVTIPEGGFAISGHGSQHTFIQDHINLGAKVSYNATTKLLTITEHLLDQTVFSFSVKKDVANTQVDTVFNGMYDVNNMDQAMDDRDTINDYIERLDTLRTDIKETYDAGKIIEFLEYKDFIEPLFEKVYFNTLVSRRIETRGIWHRPAETSLAAIEHTLDQLKSMNFTDVYLETFWNGYVVYKSDFAPYHVRFINSTFGEYEDYFTAFIAEAKKRDIDVHAWVENFFVGVSWQHSSLWNDYPEWRIEDINGNQPITGKPHGDEEGYLFFDPANPGAREFVMNVYKEIIEFDIIGLQLDYIRYPSGNENVEYSTGYTEYAINEFKELYGFEGDLRAAVRSNPAVYSQWNDYRRNVINTFVEEIHETIRPMRRDLDLSIAVGPNASYARVNLMQDWRVWVENGWIDAVKPMAYVNDVNTLVDIIVRSKEITGTIAYNYTGIAPTYFGLPRLFNAIYIDAINNNGTQGSAIFATHNLINNQPVIDVFQKGSYKNQAVATTKSMDDIFEVFIEDIMHKFENIYIKRGAATQAQKDLLETKLQSFNDQRMVNAKELQALHEALDRLTLELVLYADGAARVRLNEDIQYLMEIIDIRISRELINHGYWDPAQLNTRPDANDFEYPIEDDDVETPEVPEPSQSSPVALIVAISVTSVLVIGLTTYVIIIKRKKF